MPDGVKVTCLCCGTLYDGEMCPQRYLFPHSTEFAVSVAERLLAIGVGSRDNPPTKRQLLAAIEAERAHV